MYKKAENQRKKKKKRILLKYIRCHLYFFYMQNTIKQQIIFYIRGYQGLLSL